jgi:gliding motility-associated lipoprotein GldH
MKLMRRAFLSCQILVTACLLLCSCSHTDVFEKNTTIPGYEWKNSFDVKGSFSITDTAAAYNIYIVLRHTDAYKYNNIWLNLGIQPPGDSMHYQKIDVALATDADGWMGSGMNDIWETRQLLQFSERAPFKKAGTYIYSITQIMRDDPLPSVMSAGFRVEKR